MNELRFAFRQLRKNPGFAGIVIATLALGIGANTAIFSVVEAVLLRPLPYPAPEQLVIVSQQEGAEEHSDNWPNYLDWKEGNHSFSQFSIFRRDKFNLSGHGTPQSLNGALASADFFAAVGVEPMLGRTFRPEEDAPGGPHVVVLGESLWRRSFGGDPQVIGRAITLDGQVHTVIGVMPATLAFPRQAELWLPVGRHSTDEHWDERGSNPGLFVLARLKPDVSLGQARAEMLGISERLAKAYPADLKNVRTVVRPILETSVGPYRSGLWTLAGAALLTLAIACANVAALQLARGVARAREFAIRSALGSSRQRLIRQLVAESLVLSLLGGALGVLLAFWSLDLIRLLVPSDVPRFQQIALNPAVLIFAMLASIACGLLVGIWPARRATKSDLRTALQSGGYAGTGGRPAGRARQGLVVGQVALTMALLCGAGLLLASLQRIQREQLGFDTRNVLTFRVALPVSQYDGKQTLATQLLDNLKREVASLPGVTSVGLNYSPPLRPAWQAGFQVAGKPELPPSERPTMEVSFIDSDYFRTLGIPLLRGATFSDREQADGPRGVVIDQSFADRHFPGLDPLGRQIVLGDGWSKYPALRKVTVIGVVPTLKLFGYAEEPRLVQAYLARRQIGLLETTFFVKADGALAALAGPIREIVSRLDPALPISDVRQLDDVVATTFVSARLYSTLIGLFAAVAVLLAGLGLWGVVSYAVVQRRREIGVRLALGATRRQIVALMLAQGLTPLLAGVAGGVAAAWVTGHSLQHLLFRVSPFDPWILSSAAAGFLLVATMACWIPARRAAAVEPSEVLRNE